MEVEIVKFFQSFANRFFDIFFWFVTKMGEDIFCLLIIALIYLCYSKKFAFKFSLYYIISVGINNIVKIVFLRPRPYQASSQIKNRLLAAGSSFPSGHTQAYTIIATTGMVEINNKTKSKSLKISLLIVSIILAILMMISRMYWGQHYLSDVIAGVSFGLALPFVFDFIVNIVPKKWKSKLSIRFLYILMGLASLIVFIVMYGFESIFGISSNKVYKFLGVFVAMSIGYMFDKSYIKYNENQGFKIGLIKYLIILFVLGSLDRIVKSIFVVKTYLYFYLFLFYGLVCTILLPILFKFLFKERKKDGASSN